MTPDEHQQTHAAIRMLMAETMRINEASRRIPYEAMTMILAGAATALLLFAAAGLMLKLVAS